MKIDKMKKASQIAYQTLELVAKNIKAGVTTDYLNQIAHKYIVENNASPAFLNFQGFPKAICVSINEEVVHGIPGKRKLKTGDIVSIDIGVCFEGYYGDTGGTYPVGEVSKEKEYLIYHTKKSLEEGLKVLKANCHVGDIGYAISSYLKKHNLSVVKVLVGHGIGKRLHQKPDIPNYGKKGTGPVLRKGMTIAIEPMVNLGTDQVLIKEDGWTIITADYRPSAYFEHTVLILEDGYEILTKR